MRILFLQFLSLGQYPPLANLVRAAAREGWTPRVGNWVDPRFQLQIPGDIAQFSAFSHSGGLSRWSRVAGKVAYLAKAIASILVRPVDLLVFSDASSAWLFLLLRPLHRGKVVYIEYDAPVWTEGKRRVARFLHGTLARSADLVILPSEARAEQFSKLVMPRGRIVVAHNFPQAEEVVEGPVARRGGGLWLYYQGTLVPERLPDTLFHAIASLPFVHLTIRGVRSTPDDGMYDRLAMMVFKLGLGGRVELLPPVAPKDLKLEASQHHAGLAFFSAGSRDPNLLQMWGATNKIYQYLAYGLVPIYSTDEERMVRSLEGLGLRCDMTDSASIVEVLRRAEREHEVVAAMAERGRDRVRNEWNFEVQFDQVLKPALRSMDR